MLINPWHLHPPYFDAMCPRCGWAHKVIPLFVALRESSTREALARFYYCFRCKGPTSEFVHAAPDDALQGHTLQPVVVGVAPDVLREGGMKRTLYFETAPRDALELLELLKLHRARSKILMPVRFRILGIDVDEDDIDSVLSDADQLKAARALQTRFLNLFD